MPKKGGKKGGKKGKKKGKRGDEIEIGQPPEEAVKKLMKVYDRLSKEENRRVCSDLKRAMQHHIDAEQIITRLIVHPVSVKMPKKPALRDSFVVPLEVNLELLLRALNDSNYIYFRDLICWDIKLDFTEFAKLCMMLERQKKYRYLRQIELWNCSLSPKSALRFAESLPHTQLTHLTLDDNEIEDDGVIALCSSLRDNKLMKKLSLNYCGLTHLCAEPLGKIISTTNIIELYLDGNDVGCEGFVSLVEPLCVQADEDAFYRQAEKERKLAELMAEKEAKVNEERLQAEQLTGEEPKEESKSGKKGTKGKKKGKGKGKKKSKAAVIPETPGPFLSKLHLADNGIDSTSVTDEVDLFSVATSLARLIRGTEALSELDLNFNEIGNSAAKILQEAFEFRKEEKMTKLKFDMTCRVDKDIFEAIYKISGGGPTKKGKKGSGKGKKKGKKKK